MLDNLKQFVEKWKKLDKKTRIIYGIIAVILVIALIFSLSAGGEGGNVSDTDLNNSDNAVSITTATDTDGEGYDAAMSSTEADAGGSLVVYGDSYSSRDEVAAYIAAYGELPTNYITKSQAEGYGWKDKYDTVAQAAPGMSIGGDKFGNYEGLLPKAEGRQYYECDIDYTSGSRNSKRIVYSNDGLIFYTEDHYESFVQYDPETGSWK